MQKEGKGYFKLINLVTILLLSAILIPGSFAADPGHVAGAISTGMFESGNYTFPDSLEILKILNVSDGLLYVDPTTSRVGIGTTSPQQALHVLSNTPLRLERSGENYVNFGFAGIGNGDAITLQFTPGTSESLGYNFQTYNGASLVNAVTIQNDGNVGIGTTAPSTTLDVRGVGNFSGTIYINNATDISSFSTGVDQWGWTNTTGLVYTTQSSDLVHIGGNVSMADNLTVGGNALYVDSSSGMVGIGTTSPGAKLVVRPTTDVNFRMGHSGTGALLTEVLNDALDTYEPYRSYASSFALMLGNVGIGTTAPTHTLNVLGTANITGDLEIEGGDITIATDQNLSIDGGTLFIDDNQNRVGIGATNPTVPLMIRKSGTGTTPDTNAALGIVNEGIAYINLYDSATTAQVGIINNGGEGYVGTITGHPFSLATGNTKYLTIDTAGNVGIGTAAPTHGLNVFAASPLNVTRSGGSAGIEVDSTGNVYIRLG